MLISSLRRRTLSWTVSPSSFPLGRLPDDGLEPARGRIHELLAEPLQGGVRIEVAEVADGRLLARVDLARLAADLVGGQQTVDVLRGELTARGDHLQDHGPLLAL